MAQLVFDLEGHDYIALNNLLKAAGLTATGGEANIRIANGEIRVNGAPETQKRKKLRKGDCVEFEETLINIT